MHLSRTPVVCALLLSVAAPLMAEAQTPSEPPLPLFRAAVELVTVAAVVRDKHGKVVQSLTKDDFTVLDGGEPRRIVEFQSDANGPISVGLLIDSSGSMSGFTEVSHRVGEILLGQLNARRDDAALMTFDTRLLTLRGFTSDFDDLREAFCELDAFGATSLYDAIAGAAGVVDQQARKRRAVLVVTDGSDNRSRYTPEEVAWIASTIDVPVYVLAVTPGASGRPGPQAPGGALGEIARATGGEYFAAGTETRQAIAIARIIEDLRHQYLIAFEPSSSTALRPIEIRMRKAAHKVRSRKWYSADQD